MRRAVERDPLLQHLHPVPNLPRERLLAVRLRRRDPGGSEAERSFADRKRIFADLETPERVGRKAAARAVAKLGASSVPSTKAPVIFEAEAAGRSSAGSSPRSTARTSWSSAPSSRGSSGRRSPRPSSRSWTTARCAGARARARSTARGPVAPDDRRGPRRAPALPADLGFGPAHGCRDHGQRRARLRLAPRGGADELLRGSRRDAPRQDDRRDAARASRHGPGRFRNRRRLGRVQPAGGRFVDRRGKVEARRGGHRRRETSRHADGDRRGGERPRVPEQRRVAEPEVQGADDRGA